MRPVKRFVWVLNRFKFVYGWKNTECSIQYVNVSNIICNLLKDRFLFKRRDKRYLYTRVSYYPNAVVSFQFQRLKQSGDVSPNPGPNTVSYKQIPESVSCFLQNVRSLKALCA
jgi:hypothetical protein